MHFSSVHSAIFHFSTSCLLAVWCPDLNTIMMRGFFSQAQLDGQTPGPIPSVEIAGLKVDLKAAIQVSLVTGRCQTLSI